ncbi:protein MIS12 homolog [Physella acuta]|uniref:protein MIS12 homolog n=1 Tax=Physella acuta TaxID=109671 RepID=UPI0027DD3098|nr:protein MIS12 homolog [Physella acuta]XP_059159555.1 protein MIS12 homolog [Physella acuta]XP_059159556.1 protein MIS12 homolog [Physella acuta]XP_059159558.1 protein MIS12 homolog [Physella acuta]XP_059159559.1 protein MIS12 homolog [Physella acuta]XP_059159560.1 protein MIS12 homolog [Physella acuta]XP_059159561.1 protein MIS12 homolog [Physella acuta]XP_059159562.1 protein MIS12 homolog [Physella acuta]
MDKIPKVEGHCDNDNLKADADTDKNDNKFDYETQHFGFTPITMVNGMFNAVCDFYREAIKVFCKTLKEKYPNVMSDEELKKAGHAVSELIDKDVCEVFDAMEFFLLRDVFSIPANVILPEDVCQLTRLDKEAENDLEKRISEVKKRIISVKYANAVLSQHLEDSQALRASIDNIKKLISESNISQTGGKGIKDWLSYYSEHLKNSVLE